MNIKKRMRSYYSEKIGNTLNDPSRLRERVMERLSETGLPGNNGAGWIGQWIAGLTVGVCILYGTVILSGVSLRPKLAEYTQAAYVQSDVPAKLQGFFQFLREGFVK